MWFAGVLMGIASFLYVANVGDSRLYLIHGDSIRQVTRDHSYVEEMVSLGQMNRGSAAYREQKILSRGQWELQTMWMWTFLR